MSRYFQRDLLLAPNFPRALPQCSIRPVMLGQIQPICSFTVTVAEKLNLSGIVQADTAGASVGAIDLSTSGGLLPYTFDWTKDNVAFADTEDILYASAGQYALTVTDAAGCTAETVFLIPLVTAVSDLQNLLGLQLFPNPASDRIMLKTDGRQAMELRLTLFDAQGVLQQEWQMLQFLDVSARGFGWDGLRVGGLVR